VKLDPVFVLALLSITAATVGAQAQQPFNQQQYQRNPQIDQQNQDACMNDAMALCGQFVPDRERVAACLLSNRHRVSAPCRTALSHWHG
jgi:hypothetical protein